MFAPRSGVSGGGEAQYHHVDASDARKGRSALGWAAWAGDVSLVQYLVDNGADPNKPDSYGKTPLAICAWQGHVQATRVLMATAGIEPQKRDLFGLAPLHKAAGFGHPAVIERLLPGVSVNDLTGEVNAPSAHQAAPSLYETALHISARGGKTGVVQMLIRCGADRSVRNVKGDTALHVAARSGSWKDSHVLLAQEGPGVMSRPPADYVRMRNERGNTASDEASVNGSALLGVCLSSQVLGAIPMWCNRFLGSGQAGMHA